MSCPNCGSEMTVKVLENQTILHCPTCGGSFFEENGINRITLHEAENLALDKKTDDVSGDNKLCLKDQTRMKPLTNQENIPADVTLLLCSVCKSIFSYPDDLIKFKQAQEAKLNYYKTWKMPLPSLQSVAVLSFIALVSAALFSRFLFFNNGSLSPSQAQDLIKNVNFTSSNRYLFISFKTTIPVTAKIILTDKNTKTTMTKIISSTPKTLHILTTGDIPLTDEIWYQIVVKDKDGKEIKTEMRKMEVK